MIRDREKLREALANELAVQRGISDGWFVTDADADARAKWFARVDRILAIIDKHTAPQAEPAAEAKEWLLNAKVAVGQYRSAPDCNTTDDAKFTQAAWDEVEKLLNEAVANWGTGHINDVAINVASSMRQRAEAAEKERDQLGTTIARMQEERAKANGDIYELRQECDKLRAAALEWHDGTMWTKLSSAEEVRHRRAESGRELRDAKAAIKTLARLLAEKEAERA